VSTRETLAGDVADDGGAAEAESRCGVVHEFASRVRGQELVDLGGFEAPLAPPDRPWVRGA